VTRLSIKYKYLRGKGFPCLNKEQQRKCKMLDGIQCPPVEFLKEPKSERAESALKFPVGGWVTSLVEPANADGDTGVHGLGNGFSIARHCPTLALSQGTPKEICLVLLFSEPFVSHRKPVRFGGGVFGTSIRHLIDQKNKKELKRNPHDSLYMILLWSAISCDWYIMLL
jgi:hypothetical protein